MTWFTMSLFDKLKKWFPIPSLQKRYIIVLALLYVISKVYVAYTPTPTDDNIPDNARDVVIKLLATNENQSLQNAPSLVSLLHLKQKGFGGLL